MPFTIRYPFRPSRASVHTSLVADLFGLTRDNETHVIVDNLDIATSPGAIITFTGPSGTGKSSLLRGLAADRERLGERVIRADTLTLPETSVIDALSLPFDDALALLSQCGLAEPRLMLRTPAELSDGERWRFRLALAIAQRPEWILLDEFTAPLDRTLAKIVAFNVRRHCVRTGIGFLIATCHTDVLEDLASDVHVSCGYGSVQVSNAPKPSDKGRDSSLMATGRARLLPSRKRLSHPQSEAASQRGLRSIVPLSCPPLSSGLSFAHELTVGVGSLDDWPPFARWHYRSHHVGSVRFVALLRHLEEPIGICIFTTPPLSLAGRNRFFGRSGRWTRLSISSLNRQLAMLSRVVLHPTYRGAGLAAPFVRRSCQMCPYPWIESLAQMGHVNPFFEKAGFVRVDVPTRKRRARADESTLYGAPPRRAVPPGNAA